MFPYFVCFRFVCGLLPLAPSEVGPLWFSLVLSIRTYIDRLEISVHFDRNLIYRYCIYIFVFKQAGNATASSSTDVVMNVVAGKDPFEYTIEGLDQSSSEPAGFDVRVSALNSAGYGRPSASVNVKVTYLERWPARSG